MPQKTAVLWFVFSLLFFPWCESLQADGPKGVANPPKPPAKKKTVVTEPRTITQLFEAFTRGLEPDFKDPDQVRLFELYRVSRLGNPNEDIPSDYPQKIEAFRTQHPGIEKPNFSEVVYKKQNYLYPKISELKSGKSVQTIWENVQSMRLVLGTLLSAEKAQLIHGKKLSESDYVALFGNEEKPKTKWSENQSKEEQLKTLFVELLRLRADKKQRSEATNFVDQSLIDIANTIGFEKPLIQDTLKSREPSSYDKLAALRKGIYYREDFSGDMAQFVPPELVVKGGYTALATALALRKASKLPDDKALFQSLQTVEDEIRLKGRKVAGEPVRVRQLSRAEETLRSCLGGDCSTRTYFETAMEADYIYFTETDLAHSSKGHATVVLGTADGKKVAMLDKLQNVANDDIPYFVESVRRSLEVDGYLLGIPRDLGDHNGLSNYEFTRDYVSTELEAYQGSTQDLEGFKPHHASITNAVYSRAGQGLSLRVAKQLSAAKREQARVRTGARYESKPMGRAILENILSEIRTRKKSPDVADHFEYVYSIMALIRGGVVADPDYRSQMLEWAQNSKSVQLKNTILRQQLDFSLMHAEGVKDLETYARALHPSELQTLVQNWTQVERYRVFLENNYASLGPIRSVIAQRHPELFDASMQRLSRQGGIPFSELPAQLGVKNPADILQNRTPRERSKLASYFLSRAMSVDDKEKLRALFGAPSVEAIKAAAALTKVEQGLTPLTGEDFQALSKVFDYRLEEVLKLGDRAAANLINIYRTSSVDTRTKLAWEKPFSDLLEKSKGSVEEGNLVYTLLTEQKELLERYPSLRPKISAALDVLQSAFTRDGTQLSSDTAPAWFEAFRQASEKDRPLLLQALVLVQRTVPSPVGPTLKNGGQLYEQMRELLNSPRAEDKKWAVKFFANYSYKDHPVRYEVENAWRGGGPSNDPEVVQYLKKKDLLLELLKHPDISIAGDAAQALMKGRSNAEFQLSLDKAAEPLQKDFIRVLREGDEESKEWIARAFYGGTETPAFRQAFLEILRTGRSAALLLAAGQTLNSATPEEASAFPKLLWHESPEVQIMALKKMWSARADLSPETFAKLSTLSTHSDYERASAAIHVFAYYLQAGKAVPPDLILATVERWDLNPQERPAGHGTTTELHANEAITYLFSNLDPLTQKAISEDLKNAQGERLKKYLRALPRIFSDDIAKALALRLEDAEEDSQERILLLLSNRRDPEILRLVAKALMDPSPKTAGRALNYLQTNSEAVVRQVIREIFSPVAQWKSPGVEEKIVSLFTNHRNNAVVFEELAKLLRADPELRERVRDSLMEKSSPHAAYFFQPEFAQDREVLKNAERSVPSEKAIKEDLDLFLKQLAISHPMEVDDNYYEVLGYRIQKGYPIDVSRSPKAVQEKLLSFRPLLERREFLDELQDTLHRRILADADHAESREAHRVKCAAEISALRRK